MESVNKKFAAFIMTYRRNDTLGDTIRKLLQQSMPPQKILVVDNDPDCGARFVLDAFSGKNIHYHGMGFNSGPAGAAKAGLEILAAEGFEWIGWMDDDDPPVFENTFELLISLGECRKDCGGMGVVGQRYHIQSGLIDRVRDEELITEGPLEVDNIAGNMSKIVNGRVVREKNILPDADLFFGFEELDFDLRVQKAGFVLLADRAFYKMHREYYKRSGLHIVRGKEKPMNKLWREYYSTRNSLYIMHKHKSNLGKIRIIVRSMIKIPAGFRYGRKYGWKQARMIGMGMWHFFLGKKGQTQTL
jgi:GT2 family glycosyltransferase